MSDTSRDLADQYERNVLFHQQPRSTGLFTIPEYPELEAERGMWSAAIEAILTTLRYLAPATLLTLFWGQQSFLFKLLKHIDSAFRAIVFSSEEQKEAVLQWLAEVGPVKVEELDTVWRHGWILCGVLDAALPGACAGHPPTSMSLKHAQAIADHYLGVEPVFSRSELDLNDSLSRHQEWKLATYLDRIRQALAKLTPPVSKPTSQRTSPETTNFTLDYVAKGSGLTAAQVNNKMHFKIYPTSQQALDPGEITILIRGPKDTYGMAVLPPTLGKAQLIRQKLLGLQSKQNYTENVLPITQGATYLRSYGKNDMNKTYFIPKTRYEIEIEAAPRPDHLKISYEVSIEGKYEISITSRGQNIVGSPFSVKASNNIIGILERDSFCLEDGEEIDIVDVKTDRKVVLRIVDFVTEKMLLKENGTLEKISDDEVKLLMATDIKKPINDKFNIDNEISAVTITDVCGQVNKLKFNSVAHKILIMNRVCKIFNDAMIEKQKQYLKADNNFIYQRSQQDIPDIVNSTFTENTNPYTMSQKRDKFIIPESISVSLRTEKSKSLYEEEISNATIEIESAAVDIPIEIIDLSSPEYNVDAVLENFKISDDQADDDIASLDKTTISSNPFLTDMCEENYNLAEKNLGTFVTSEYETNNSQNEETRDSSIKIIIDTTNGTPSPMNNNPFIDTDITELERPKTPVYKIIAGEEINRNDPVFIDPKTEHPSDEILGNEFINPFFMHQHIVNTDQHKIDSSQPNLNFPVADFIIGAPVSLPPIIRAPSPQPDIKPMMDANKIKKIKTKENKLVNQEKDISQSSLSTSVDTKTGKKENNSSGSSNFHSLESNLTDNSNASTGDNNFDNYRNQGLHSNRNVSPKKDTWDSAYVSIDESNSSPDTNNNENTLCETLNKQKFSPCDVNLGFKQEELSNMGPAERELWQTCRDLNDDDNKIQDDIKPYKWEIKRPMFTPIIEESDRSISAGMKELSRAGTQHGETDHVTVAFAELNDMYQEYFPNSDMSSTTTANEDTELQSMDVEYTIDTKDDNVDSASELLSDVKRHAEILEGTISEVQANVTESFSVSQTLHNKEADQSTNFDGLNKAKTQFGDSEYTNIVLEKKKYWDEKIRQIQAKTEETAKHQRKRRVSSKQLKHNDSLTKRRGKQIIKNFLNAGDHQIKQAKSINIAAKHSEIVIQEPITQETSEQEQLQSEENLVEKWKKYWDDKLETEHNETDSTNLRAKSLKEKMGISNPQENIDTKPSELKDRLTIPIKHELPEEVFKAFETSPKRFFGTSRKQILNKIDTFLGKPITVEESVSVDEGGRKHDSGLVSSRISLFHNLSHTEELPWARRKCQSLSSIPNRKDSVKSDNSENIIIIDIAADTGTPATASVTAKETQDTTNNQRIENNLASKDIKLLKDKRARMERNMQDQSFEEPEEDQTKIHSRDEKKITYVKKDHRSSHIDKYKKNNVLRRTSISKSETDIFNKVPNEPADDCMEKYKSCDELPKINVKSFISLYESVTKTAAESKQVKRIYSMSSIDSQKHLVTISTNTGAVNELDGKCITPDGETNSTSELKSKPVTPLKQWLNRSSETVSSDDSLERKTHTYFTDTVNKLILTSTPVDECPKKRTPKNQWLNKSSETVSCDSIDKKTDKETNSFDLVTQPNDDKETTYLSLSDIELEIVENSSDKSLESSPERTRDPAHIEYKSRFKSAKQFFQSLEELREVKKPRKLNECELLLNNKSTESLDNERPQKRVKKNIKSHSMPSSEISKIWKELHGNEDSDSSSTKLVKISEKFNVDDLFTDVMEGKLSRQGSLRGIPHKKAVLEAFRSMENLTDGKMSPYELAVTQLNDYAKENKIKNAQTYLSEYPYLPTTDPSKYHSRLDAKASGLISFKELLGKKPRRNSVPDLRLNLKFEVDL